MMFDWVGKFGMRLPLVLGVFFVAVIFLGSCQPSSGTDSTGRLLNSTVLGETGRHPGQFVYPRAMDLYTDAQGRPIAVIIDKTARMQAIDLTTGQSTGLVHMPEFSNGMPTGLTIGPSLMDPAKLAAYVPDTHEHRLLVYALPLIEDQSVPIFEFGTFGEEPSEFIYPTDVALLHDEQGNISELLVSEYGGNDRITRYAVVDQGEGVSLRWVGQIGVASETVDGSDDPVDSAALSRPQSFAIWDNDGQTEVVILDSSHHRIVRMGLEGQRIGVYKADHDPNYPAMKFPYGITILNNGNRDATALITEFGGCLVRHIDLATGATLQTLGVPGRSMGQLATPWASNIIGDTLVILDSGNNRLQLLDSDVLVDFVSVAGLGEVGEFGGNP